MSDNKIIAHGCGGAGINICDDSLTKVSALGDGFANIVYNYLDTSRVNIDKIEPKGDFWEIKTQTFGKGTIVGSGGERKTHAKDIVNSVSEYLDKNNYLKRHVNEYHFVIFSASGGSGSTIGPVLVKNLLSKHIPVVCVVVGDSSNGLNAINTINTLASLNQIALTANKPLSIIYINNHMYVKDGGLNQAEKDVNRIIFNIMSVMALFLSGQNEDLDNQDMYGIIDQSQYTTIDISPGLFGLTVHNNTISLPEGAIPTVGRTLTLTGHDFDTNLTLLHHKRGYVTNENVNRIYNNNSYPLHLIAHANFLKIEENNLKAITDDYYNIMSNIKNEHVGGSSRSALDEDTGLIF